LSHTRVDWVQVGWETKGGEKKVETMEYGGVWGYRLKS